jgi:hypothetical protein
MAVLRPVPAPSPRGKTNQVWTVVIASKETVSRGRNIDVGVCFTKESLWFLTCRLIFQRNTGHKSSAIEELLTIFTIQHWGSYMYFDLDFFT